MGDKILQMQGFWVKRGSNIQNQQYFEKKSTSWSENHAECSISGLELVNMS